MVTLFVCTLVTSQLISNQVQKELKELFYKDDSKREALKTPELK